MSTAGIEFRRGAVRPVRCLTDGWRLIRDDYWKFLGISVVAMFIASFAPMYILMGPMLCGVFLALLRQARGRRVPFDTVFRGFDHFIQSLIATLVIITPVMVILVPLALGVMVFAQQGLVPPPAPGGRPAPPDPAAMWTFFATVFGFWGLVFSVMVVVYSLFLFTFPLIVDRGLTGMEAVGVSSRAALANLGGILALVVLNNVLSFSAVLVCCVGTYLVLPLNFASVAVAYRQVFPDDDGDDGPLPPGESEPDHGSADGENDRWEPTT